MNETKTDKPQEEVRNILHSELCKTQAQNPSYSMRAYAKRIGVFQSALSEIMAGKRKITPKMAQKILLGLDVPPHKIARIIDAIKSEASKSKNSRDGQKNTPSYTLLDMDQYQVVSEWQYFAILSLADTDDFQGDAKWVAKRLGISSRIAKNSLERLERLGLLKKEAGRLSSTGKQFETTTDIPNESLRKHHYQNLELAKSSLDQDDIEARDFSFINIAGSAEKLPEVKRRIKEFRRDIAEYFESGERNEVFKICIQLFPQTKLEN